VQKVFELDFKTKMYRKFAMHKFSNPHFDLSNTDYLRMVIHQILLNISINESDIEASNYRLEQPWLNSLRNKIVSSFTNQDIVNMHNSALEIEHGWDKSIEFISHFRHHTPKTRKPSSVNAQRYVQSGFNLLIPKNN